MSDGLLPLGQVGGWVPAACTLPTVEQPLRVAEFDRLFAASLRRVERTSPSQLRLRLDRSAEAMVRELTDRETRCCSFFGFGFGYAEPDRVVVDVTVPGAQAAVLDALADRAGAVMKASA
jgi:hypothetical protein